VSARRPTSHDVARAAGVSQSTVSYALSGKGTLSAATRERVLAAAAELGYRPNLAARSMRTRRSGRLAVVTGAAVDNRLQMLTGAGEVAAQAGYALDTHSVEGTAEDRTARVVELARGGQVEGVLTFLPVLPDALALEDDAAPVVAATAFDEHMRSVGELADAGPLGAMVDALVDAGHRRFLHVAGPGQYASARSRRAVYLAAVERRGATSLGVVGDSWSPASGREAVLALPGDAPPLAVVAANDHVALGVLRGAAERGWSVPGDLVVTGWDDAEFGAYTTPTLTTVTVDLREAGRRAMHRLVAAVRGEEPPATPAPLQRIVWRESTGAAPGAR
jgi:DNA-binding LacI/PurR family transcriptional regulator